MPLDVDPGKFGEQRDPQMERRVLLLMGVAFLVLVSWQSFITRRYPPAAPRAPLAPVVAPEAVPSLGKAETAAPAEAPAEEAPRAGTPPAGAYEPVAESEIRTAVVMTDNFEATFTNKGARLRSLKLRKYAETLPKRGDPPRPLETIPRDAIERGLLPLSVEVEGRPELGPALDAALFQLDAPRLDLGEDGQGTLTFHHRTPDGLDVEKRISFAGGTYLMKVEVKVVQLARRGEDGATLPQEVLPVRLSWGPGFSNPPGHLLSREGGMSSYDYFGRAIYHTDRKNYRTAKASVEAPLVVPGQVSWAGLEERYFALVFLPTERLRSVTYEPVAVSADGKERNELRLSVGLDGPVGVFVGPKEYEVLQATHASLPDVIEFGTWFGWLAKGMLLVLKRLEAQTGNYGVAIVLLTLLIKLVLFPLTLQSYRSMKRMQKLQPKMNAIREKYKRLPSDPSERREHKMKMNEEIMGLYKKEGVNPVGGCFPMLLQMPFLFAFYSLLSVAIELRHAPFYFWIHDLSQRDPVYITPILMTLAQFVSQKLTPISSPDPVQQRMMTYMPLFFLFIFVNVPSGLVIYWLTSNLFQIGQQLTLNRLERRTLAPARS